MKIFTKKNFMRFMGIAFMYIPVWSAVKLYQIYSGTVSFSGLDMIMLVGYIGASFFIKAVDLIITGNSGTLTIELNKRS